jgi:orotate phosphoribosyltransferase
MNYKEKFIELMVKSNVLQFGDFTAKSGRRTPYFINTGNFTTGRQISELGDFYAECFMNSAKEHADILFGPAYKGIPLVVAAAAALYRNHQVDIPYCFNRKEAKDHGEGGSLIGHKPKSGDRIAIIEDVITAGTAVRESINLFNSFSNVSITTLIVSVNRMEKGTGDKTAFQELESEFGIKTFSIVNIRDIIAYLHNKEVDGRIWIDDAIKGKIEAYLEIYGV